MGDYERRCIVCSRAQYSSEKPGPGIPIDLQDDLQDFLDKPIDTEH